MLTDKTDRQTDRY